MRQSRSNLGALLRSLFTAAGQLLSSSGANTPVAIPAPSEGQVLRGRAAAEGKMAWEAPAFAIAEVTNLQSTLNQKSDTGHGHTIADVALLQSALNAKADTGHGHTIADVALLQTALDSKSDTGHGHVMGDVSGLSAALALKANVSALSTVATTGSYTDLTDKPSLGSASSKNVPLSGDAGATEVMLGNDSRNTNARTPTSHATSHRHGGSDEIATTTPAANAIPKAGVGGTLDEGWIPILSASKGGTGLSALGTPLYYLRVNAAGTGLEYATAGGSTAPFDLTLFGSGADGDVTISGAVTLTRPMFYRNLVIQAGGTLNTAGFPVSVSQKLTIIGAGAGAIQCNGSVGNNANGSGGANGGSTLSASTAWLPVAAQGAAGGTGFTGVGGSGNTGTANAFSFTGRGGTGGNGGSGASGSGASGTTTSMPSPTFVPSHVPPGAYATWIQRNSVNPNTAMGGSGGGGGAGDGTFAGGGGGGAGCGGHMVLVFAKQIERDATTAAGAISAKGGNGGTGGTPSGGNCGGGGGGGGGAGGGVIIVYKELLGTAATNAIDASGGNGGNGGSKTGTGTVGTGGWGASGGWVVLHDMTSGTPAVTDGRVTGSLSGAPYAPSGQTAGTGGQVKVAL